MLKFSEVVRKLRNYYLNFIDEDSLETEFTIYQQNVQWYALALVSVAVLFLYYAANTSCSLSVV